MVPRVIFLLLALLVPTANSLFGKTKPIRSSTLPSNDEIDPTLQTPEAQEDSHTDDEGLVFEGKFNYQSETLLMPTSRMLSQDLFEFFSDSKNRDLVIKGGGNPCESIQMTPELHEEWTSQSKVVKSTPPSTGNTKTEEILAVYSQVPIVPGLSLRAVSYTGCKTMKEPKSALPYYEFTLLKETYQPVGRKAMTWIFDKVTGNKKKAHEKGENKKDIETDSAISAATAGDTDRSSSGASNSSPSRKTYCLSRVTLKPSDGGCKICYYGHVRLTLSKRFLHMLPLPTKVVQKKVNKSIRNQLECECTRSMQKFTGALNRWNERLTAVQ